MIAVVRLYEALTRRPWQWAIALHAIAVVILVGRLPNDGWFVGDPGIKLVAARSAIAHPSRPLETELPPVAAVDIEAFRQPFYVPHGDHAHAFTSAFFPLLTAPFVAAFGLTGLYVLPALAWLALPPLTIALSRRLQARASPTAIWIATAAMTPVVFYGLEFWEHAPALAVWLASCVLALPPPRQGSGNVERVPAPRLLALAGFVGAIAVLLRPEMIWSLTALVMVVCLRRQHARDRITVVTSYAAGVAVGLAPQFAYNLIHFGVASPEHVSGNLAALSTSWWAERRAFADVWLGVHRGWTRVAMALVVLGAVAGRLGERRRWPLAVAMVGAAGFAFEIARGHELRENLWRVLPLALIALMPVSRSSPARRALWILALVPLAGVLLTSPNDGGGQWGPRYLLAIAPPLILLALDATTTFAAVVGRRVAWTFVALIMTASLFVSRSAWIELRDAKTFYSAMAATTAVEAGDRLVLTDVWWVPQVNAAVLDHRRVLWVDTPVKGARWLATRPAPEILLILNAAAPPDFPAWTRDSCYRAGAEPRSEHGLVFVSLRCP